MQIIACKSMPENILKPADMSIDCELAGEIVQIVPGSIMQSPQQTETDSGAG